MPDEKIGMPMPCSEEVCEEEKLNFTALTLQAACSQSRYLVSIPGDGVGAFHACQPCVTLDGESGCSAPGRIDVHPQVVLVTYLTNPLEKIKAACG